MLLFDIGSNIGSWALQNYSTNTQIICVEASPSTFKKLVKNVSEKNIVCLNYAVTSNQNSKIDFFDCAADTISTLDEDWLISNTSRFGNRYYYKKIEVDTITIDKLVSMYGIPDLLKIDVEGAENIVLKSLTTPLNTICFEWASEWNEKTIDGLNHLESLGYTKFNIQKADNYVYRPNSYNLNKDEVIEYLLSTIPKQDWGMIWTTI